MRASVCSQLLLYLTWSAFVRRQLPIAYSCLLPAFGFSSFLFLDFHSFPLYSFPLSWFPVPITAFSSLPCHFPAFSFVSYSLLLTFSLHFLSLDFSFLPSHSLLFAFHSFSLFSHPFLLLSLTALFIPFLLLSLTPLSF